MTELLGGSWPWYVGGPLIGLVVPALLLIGCKLFGVSANLRHTCAAVAPGRAEFLRYDWKGSGGWNLTFAVGILIGGFLAGTALPGPEPVEIAAESRDALSSLGITDFTGMVPAEIFSWSALFTVPGFVSLVIGGFLIGFGAAYAGGCTSGHAISGLADLQPASLLAVVGFFVGGLIVTHLIYPLML